MLLRFAALLFTAILTGIIISCANVQKEPTSVLTSQHAQVSSAEVDDSDLVLYASLLDHPHVFEPGTLEAVMRMLYFSPVGSDRQFWGEKRSIFTEKTAQEAGPLIRKAFLVAKPYQKIQFRIQTEKGGTAGDTFILDDALHWRFQLIEDTPQFDEFYNVFEFGGETSWPTNWVLVPQEGQQFYGSKLLPKIADKKFWVAMALPPGTRKDTTLQQPDSKVKPPEADRGSLMKRLSLLRELKDEGLISDEDYQNKVRALVEVKNAAVPDPKDRLLFLKDLRDEGLISEGEYKNKVHEILEAL